MSAKEKSGLGYGNQIHEGVLSYENEVLESVFDSRSSDVEDSHVNDRFAKVKGMHAVPPLMTRIYMPPKSDFGIDESKFTYVESKPKAVSEPKVWSDAPIIEEYESDSDDEYMFKASVEQEKSSCDYINIVKHVKTPRKACFVCDSFSHLIRDCDFLEKRMAKQVELNKSKNKVTCQRNDRPVWNNVQRLNHQNKFVPTAILTKTSRFPVNAARQKFSSQAALTGTVRKVNTARPIVNEIRPRNNVYKYHSSIRRPFNRTTTPKANFENHKVNIVMDKIVNAVGGNQKTVVKTSADFKRKSIVDSGCSRHMTGNKAYLVEYQDFNGGPVAFGGSKGQITGIKREYSNARTPQQNGVVERKNITLIEVARTMLADLFLPNTFWVEAVSTACYVLNRVLVTKPQNKTPYELITGKGPTWLFDLDYLTDSMNYQPVTAENKATKTTAKHVQEYFVLPLWSSYTSTVKSSEAKNGDEKPIGDIGSKTTKEPVDQEDQAFLEELESFKRQEKEVDDAAETLRKTFAKSIEDLLLQAGAARANSTNNVNTASIPVNTASKPVNTASTPVNTASISRNVSVVGPSL
nr:putative ribonuclease H-like domain-containing protein [Tanacetum cinerariifolium]